MTQLFLSSVKMLLNIIFRCQEILVYFRSCYLENQPVFSPPVQVQLHSKFGLSALFCTSPKRLEQIFFKSLPIIFILYIIKSETFIEIDSPQRLGNFKRNLSYKPVKNPRYNIHCFDQYANFSKLMRTIHISMNNTFQCEYRHVLHSNDAINSKMDRKNENTPKFPGIKT